VRGEFNRGQDIHRRKFMKDIIFIAVTLAFFVIALAYVRFCDRIR
jgi:hypothetical protein